MNDGNERVNGIISLLILGALARETISVAYFKRVRAL